MSVAAGLGVLGGAAVFGVGEVLLRLSAYGVAEGKQVEKPTRYSDYGLALIQWGGRVMGSFALLAAIPATITSAVGAGMLAVSALSLTRYAAYSTITGVAMGALAATRCVYTIYRNQ